MTDRKLLVSAGPHVRGGASTTSVMGDVLIALLPAVVASVLVFGTRALLLEVVCVAASILFEYLFRKITKRTNTISDLSAAVTGLLLAMNLPAGFPIWMAIVGCFVAIVIVKQLFGGIGCNFMNPALVGRAVLLASYATAMTTWAVPMSKLSIFGSNADAVTSSTPLAIMKGGDLASLTSNYSVVDMFLGRIGGSLGEVSALMLLLGGVYLVIRKVISWHTPVAFIATVAVLCLISAPAGISAVDYMLYNVFGGGLMLGAIFMATDYATSPVTKPGQIIFGIGCGLLTCFIRRFGSYPEGVCYSILIMNCTTWLLDKYIRPTIYGAPKKEKKEAAAK